MAFTCTSDQIVNIKDALSTGRYADAYSKAADYADGQPGADQLSVIWLRGAAEVNSHDGGAYDTFIRSYTDAQIRERGLTPNVDDQDVSNNVATSVLKQITDTGTLPPIEFIGGRDAAPAAAGLFNSDIGAWAGTPLFVAFGIDRYFKGIISGTDTYDVITQGPF